MLEKYERTFLWTLVFVVLILSIINYISTEQNERVIETLEERQEFLDDISYETIKTQSSIIRTQRTILEMIGELILREECFYGVYRDKLQMSGLRI